MCTWCGLEPHMQVNEKFRIAFKTLTGFKLSLNLVWQAITYFYQVTNKGPNAKNSRCIKVIDWINQYYGYKILNLITKGVPIQRIITIPFFREDMFNFNYLCKYGVNFDVIYNLNSCRNNVHKQHNDIVICPNKLRIIRELPKFKFVGVNNIYLEEYNKTIQIHNDHFDDWVYLLGYVKLMLDNPNNLIQYTRHINGYNIFHSLTVGTAYTLLYQLPEFYDEQEIDNSLVMGYEDFKQPKKIDIVLNDFYSSYISGLVPYNVEIPVLMTCQFFKFGVDDMDLLLASSYSNALGNILLNSLYKYTNIKKPKYSYCRNNLARLMLRYYNNLDSIIITQPLNVMKNQYLNLIYPDPLPSISVPQKICEDIKILEPLLPKNKLYITPNHHVNFKRREYYKNCPLVDNTKSSVITIDYYDDVTIVENEKPEADPFIDNIISKKGVIDVATIRKIPGVTKENIKEVIGKVNKKLKWLKAAGPQIDEDVIDIFDEYVQLNCKLNFSKANLKNSIEFINQKCNKQYPVLDPEKYSEFNARLNFVKSKDYVPVQRKERVVDKLVKKEHYFKYLEYSDPSWSPIRLDAEKSVDCDYVRNSFKNKNVEKLKTKKSKKGFDYYVLNFDWAKTTIKKFFEIYNKSVVYKSECQNKLETLKIFQNRCIYKLSDVDSAWRFNTPNTKYIRSYLPFTHRTFKKSKFVKLNTCNLYSLKY